MSLTKSELAKYMDHTLLKADATAEQIDRVTAEARELNTASVCVNGYWVPRVAAALEGTDVMTCAVIGFPLGAMSTAGKAAETEAAVSDGANELDMVINVGWLLAGEDGLVRRDIEAVLAAAQGRCVKVIIETCLLSDEQIVRACEIAVEAGASFVKTSTGFSTGGATVEGVALMARTVAGRCKVKASGGIHTAAEAEAMVAAGASRIGTSSGLAIIGA